MPWLVPAGATLSWLERMVVLDWCRESSPVERRTFWACFGGWALGMAIGLDAAFAYALVLLALLLLPETKSRTLDAKIASPA
jgi:hypothetical protein